MPPPKIKPPKETKAELMVEVMEAIAQKFDHNPVKMMEYTLNFFTAYDLSLIRDDLKRLENNGV